MDHLFSGCIKHNRRYILDLDIVMKFMSVSRLWLSVSVVLSLHVHLMAQDHSKAREVVEAAIEAMGGESYLQVKNSHSQGLYYGFDKEERTRAFTRFQDWTVYGPIKWRFQLGKGEKRRKVTIYNLEIEKGWILEGQSHVEEIPEEAVRRFGIRAGQDMDVLFRKRLDEEGMHLYYYGPQEIAGSGEYEAVEFLDATNNAIVIFFDRETHLPSKLETQRTNQLGVRQKHEQELYNWHTIQGVHVPLRYDSFVDGKKATQRELEAISFNVDIPPGHFLEPKPKK